VLADNRIVIGLMALIGAGATAGVSTYFLQGEAIGLIENASTNESSWVCVNGRGDLYAMREALADFAADASTETAQKLQLRADIFAGRLDSLRVGEFKGILERSADARANLAALDARRAVVDQLAADEAGPQDPAAANKAIPAMLRAYDDFCLSVTGENQRSLIGYGARLHRERGDTLASILVVFCSGVGAIAWLTWRARSTEAALRRQRDLAKELEARAGLDPLTGLANRARFESALNADIAAALADGGEVVLFAIDLDRFKSVNDLLGHPTGDALLASVARRLESFAIGEPGLRLARIGGDEFCAWTRLVADSCESGRLAESLVRSLAKPHSAGGHTLIAHASVGYAAFPRHADDTKALIELSDVALNRAKAAGRGVAVAYQDGMADELRLRQLLEIDLAKALAEDQLELHYQPWVELPTGRVAGVEALARWRHPTRGSILPAVFIPIAEASGLIEELGRWALMRACRDAARLPAHLRVAVNLSAAQFRGDVVALTADVLAETLIDPARLELEITESVMILDPSAVGPLFERLRALGVGVTLDDFGTGFSSLSYLRQFKFGKLKIDRSFVSEIECSMEAQAIICTVVELARSLGMSVIAEGIETEAQASLARAAGCDLAQGYYFARPQPIEALLGLLRDAADLRPRVAA
jgi:diguanylate cyclase (GGDEF)-like protein